MGAAPAVHGGTDRDSKRSLPRPQATPGGTVGVEARHARTLPGSGSQAEG